MQFQLSTFAVLAGLAMSVTAAPVDKRALASSTYNALSISAGTAGNAKAEALAKFPINTSNLAGVSAVDLTIIKNAHNIAEAAEVSAFNPAIAAATGAAKKALSAGKTKNKVLKLTAEVLSLQIEAAQGTASASAKAAVEQVKLTKNIALDVAAKGQPSTAVSAGGST